ncbi:MAG: NAD(P)/FAD-dependent oxidoreductase [Candidatus Methanomethyliaceae archaeon]|nr:NAD(P)/FAD-dependent oxidoreductase [Candidatus Methanomethyliaceae archaeon]MDW7970539.1 NAD(P)/FAD-dependent oxidoreductase [Nitrososphaerota archaeon]
MEYDAVIVGAGPAGLMAARKIADKGFSVLILEKNKDLGVRACAEAVSASAFETAEIPPSPSLISNSINGAYIYPPDEKKYVKISGGNYRGYILNKPLFLYALASIAASKGCDIKMQCEVIDVEFSNNRAHYLKYRYKDEWHYVKFKYLIGADGVGSIVARSCKFDMSNYEIIPTIQYVMVNCNIPERDMIRIYLGNEVAPRGYAWIFAKNEYVANVGIGVRGAPAKPYLEKFIESHGDFFKKAKIIKEGGGGVPVGGQLNELVKGNVLLCGDAAGQVIPLTGGGIRSSMEAGKIVGECVAKALEANDSSLLNEYPKRYMNPWGNRISKSLKVLRVFEELSDEDLNALAEVLVGEDVVDLANGLDIKRVAVKLMSHPVLALKIAYKLI